MRGQGEPLPVRLYRRALAILPRRFRRRYGAAMVAMLADEWRERGGLRRSGLRRGALMATALLDLLWTATTERIGGSGRQPQKGLGMKSKRAGWVSWLDFKLGLRMLVKQPGLTVVGGMAMAVAMGTGAAWFDLLNDFFDPTLPLVEGDRIVGIKNWNTEAGAPELRSLHDFVAWREDLRSVVDLSAFTRLERNLITADGQSRLVEGAAITASAFRLARVPPLLGRSLVDADEQPSASPVVVLGYDVWRDRFAGDPAVVGQVLKLGATPHTVVGVMPEGFTYPVRHDLWVPLRVNVLHYERRHGPELWVFGRLAPATTLDEAQAELTALGLRASAEYSGTHEHLRPRVVPYPLLFSNPETATIYAIQAVYILLLVLVCANVGTLVFARVAMREGEMVVRSALGASRGRIVVQLFIETLLLASLAAMIGLGAAAWARPWMDLTVDEMGVPFWMNAQLAPTTVLYVAVLTALCAVVAGVVPALKATGRGVEAGLRHSAVGGPGLRFGGLWTGVIVTQVALIVAVLPVAISLGWEAIRFQSVELGFTAEDYLAVELEMEQEPLETDTAQAASLSRFRSAYHELKRRLLTQAGVAGVTFASRVPGMQHRQRQIEVDRLPPTQAPSPRQEVSAAAADPDFFEVMGASIVTGRAFNVGDAEPGSRAVIVNQSFVRHILGGSDPLGLRVRYAGPAEEEPEPWYEIVGVVTDLRTDPYDPGAATRLYHPLTVDPAAPVGARAVVMIVRRAWRSESFTPQLRAIAAEVEPALRVRRLQTVDELLSRAEGEGKLLVSLVALGVMLAVLLSAAGIYSLVSFTVSQRTREIGIRAALGARPRRIIGTILSRVLAQVGLGVVGGGLIVASIVVFGSETSLSREGFIVFLTAAAGMMLVGLLACALPARRALRIQPTEALKDG